MAIGMERGAWGMGIKPRGQRSEVRSQRSEVGGQKTGVFEIVVLERGFAVFTVAVRGYGQAEGMGPKMCHSAEKVYGFFRIFIL